MVACHLVVRISGFNLCVISKHAYVCQCAKISQTAERFVLLCAVPWVLSKVGYCLLAVEEVGVGKNQSQTEPNCFFPHQDFFYEDMESLTQMLKALATDGNKHRAKVDKRKQRSVFRDVLRAVEERDFPTETVKFGPERMYIDCWVKKLTYDTFKEVLGSGMQYHLQVRVASFLFVCF